MDPGTGSVARQQKGGWLEEFQQTSVAWNVAVDLLARGQHQVFAASMLSKKIKSSWSSLQKEHKKELCDVVLSLVSQQSVPLDLVQTLTLTITNIIVQSTPHEWPDPVNDTMYLALGTPESTHDTRGAWIALVRNLAEEMSKPQTSIATQQHDQLKKYIKDVSADLVIRTLLDFIEESCTDQTSSMASDAITALQPWFQLAPNTTNTTLRAYEVVVNAILTSPTTLLDAGSEVLNDISGLLTLPLYPQTTDAILEQALRLGPLLPQALESDDEDAVLRLLTCFASIGINLTSVLLKNREGGCELTTLVVNCCEMSKALASEVSDYWQELHTAMVGEPDFDDLLDLYMPAMQQMVQLILRHCRIHEEDDEDVGAMQDKRDLRKNCSDLLVQFFTVIPEEEFEILYSLLQDSLLSYERQPTRDAETWIEVALWGWHCLADEYADEEEWPHKLMKLFQSLPTTSMLIQKTSLELISATAYWLNRHPETLPLALSHLVNALENPDLADTASKGLSWISEECGELLPPLLGEILDQLEPTMSSLTPSQQCRVISCLANQVTYLPPEEGLSLLVKLAGDLPASLVALTRETKQYNLLQRERLINGINFIAELMVSPGDPIQRDSHHLPEKRVSSSTGPPKLTPDEKYLTQIEWAQVALQPLVDLTFEIVEATVHAADLDEGMCAPVLKYMARVCSALKRYVFAPYLPKVLGLLCTMFSRTASTSLFKPYELLCAVYRCVHQQHDLQRMPEAEAQHLAELGLLLHVASGGPNGVSPSLPVGGIPGASRFRINVADEPANATFTANSALADPSSELPAEHPVHAFSLAFTSLSELALQLFASSGSTGAEEIELIQFYFQQCVSATLTFIPRAFFSNVECVVAVCQFAVNIIPALTRHEEVKIIRGFLVRLFMTDVSRVMPAQEASDFQEFKKNLFEVMMSNILYGLSGPSPRSLTQSLSSLVHEFLISHPQLCSDTVHTLLNKPGFPNDVIDMERKRGFISRILQAATSPGSMYTVLHDFAVVCRGIESTFLATLKPGR